MGIYNCKTCKKEFTQKTVPYRSQCRSCNIKEDIQLGIRKTFADYNKSLLGKTFEERFGKEKAKLLKENLSQKNQGLNNPNSKINGGKWHGEHPSSFQKGKTFEELYGNDKAQSLKTQKSKRFSGKNNPMYGKPSPKGSGNGWSGWYKDWYFRSLKELSYMVNVIEAQNLSWENGEKSKFKVLYIDPITQNERTYHCDFFINNTLIEIKPKRLTNSIFNTTKRLAAEAFCKSKNWKYKIIIETDYAQLTTKELYKLYKSKLLKWLPRYEKLFLEQYKSLEF